MLTETRQNHSKLAARPSKNKPHKRGNKTAQRLHFHSKTCVAGEISEFPKLDPSVPEQKRRLEQRRKMISYGKNTVGYDIYIQKIPKHQRKKKSMETPTTPDHTLNIPNKRWVGQVRAWRRALHQYDPADLQQSLASAAATQPDACMEEAKPEALSVQEQELAQAREKGLLVDLGPSKRTSEESSPTSVAGVDPLQQQEMKELDQWDAFRGTDDGEFDSDSDDDLL